jgi:arylsulfatase A-like enzyme
MLITLLFSALPSCTKDGRDGMNVILVLVDTLRADHLGCYGHTRDTSPDLDAFSKRCAVFRRHFAHASRTGPSVASLMTSLHVKSHGVVNPLLRRDGIGVLEESVTTMAEILKQAGYTCRAAVSNPNVYPRYGFAQGFDLYAPLHIHAGAEQVNAVAVSWFEEMKSPFFLYLHYMDPHSPYGSPHEKAFVDPAYSGPFTGEHAQLDEVLEGRLKADDADRRHLEALYDQDILHWDRAFGKLLQVLKENRLLENTMVIVVSDHGEEFLEHGGLLHGYTLYREQLHVPFLLFTPGRAHVEVEATSRNIDLLPTILELLEIPAPAELQGTSLVPLMEGRTLGELPVLAQTGIRAAKTTKVRAFQVGGWKYIENLYPEDRPGELYDLTADPVEQTNLLDKGTGAAEMRKNMEAFAEKLPHRQSRSVKLDQEGLEMLKALGYIK